MRFILLLICALLPLGNLWAATATATWSFTDALGRPLRSKPVSLTPLFYTTLDGTNYVVTDPIFGTTDTNGQYAATNVLLGYGYRAQVTGYAATAVTNYFPPDIAGQSVAAAAYTFAYATTTNFAYTMPQADARFAPLSVTNVANTNTINALAGVQAAAAVAPYTNQVTASAINAAVPGIVTNSLGDNSEIQIQNENGVLQIANNRVTISSGVGNIHIETNGAIAIVDGYGATIESDLAGGWFVGGSVEATSFIADSFSGNGAGLTNLPVLSPQEVTNIAASFSSIGNRIAYMPSSTNNMIATTSYTALDSTYYGSVFQSFIESDLSATNVTVAMSAVSNGTPATIYIWSLSKPKTNAFSVSSMASYLIYSNSISVNIVNRYEVQSFPVNCNLSAGQYAVVGIMSSQSNMLKTAFISGSVDNTNGTRFALFVSGSLNYWGSAYYPVSYTFAASCARFGYSETYLLNPQTAKTTQYAATVDPSLGTNVHSAIERLLYQFNQTNTSVVVGGDSRAAGLYYHLTNSWFSSCQKVSIASPGSLIGYASLAWQTNAAFFYNTNILAGKTGIYVYSSGANSVNSDPYTAITTISNHITDVVASNYLFCALTIQPLAAYNTDNAGSRLFVKTVNNYLRTEPRIWRVVDAELMAPNNYDKTMYLDTVHPTEIGYAMIARELFRQINARDRIAPSQSWVGAYGTNVVCVVPGSNAPATTVWSAWSGGFDLSVPITVPTNFTAANMAPVAGKITICASNNVLYFITTTTTNHIP